MNTPEPSTPEDWLLPLLHYVRWTAWEVVNILSDLPPVAPAHAAPATREQLIEQARRRADPERHASDAIQQRELIVDRGLADRQFLDALKPDVDDKQRQEMARHVAAHQLYKPWTVEPSVAIKWFLSRRDLFPRCRLAEEHLAIARAALTRSSAPTIPERELAPKPARPVLDPSLALKDHRTMLVKNALRRKGVTREQFLRTNNISPDVLRGVVNGDRGRVNLARWTPTILTLLEITDDDWNQA